MSAKEGRLDAQRVEALTRQMQWVAETKGLDEAHKLVQLGDRSASLCIRAAQFAESHAFDEALEALREVLEANRDPYLSQTYWVLQAAVLGRDVLQAKEESRQQIRQWVLDALSIAEHQDPCIRDEDSLAAMHLLLMNEVGGMDDKEARQLAESADRAQRRGDDLSEALASLVLSRAHLFQDRAASERFLQRAESLLHTRPGSFAWGLRCLIVCEVKMNSFNYREAVSAADWARQTFQELGRSSDAEYAERAAELAYELQTAAVREGIMDGGPISPSVIAEFHAWICEVMVELVRTGPEAVETWPALLHRCGGEKKALDLVADVDCFERMCRFDAYRARRLHAYYSRDSCTESLHSALAMFLESELVTDLPRHLAFVRVMTGATQDEWTRFVAETDKESLRATLDELREMAAAFPAAEVEGISDDSSPSMLTRSIHRLFEGDDLARLAALVRAGQVEEEDAVAWARETVSPPAPAKMVETLERARHLRGRGSWNEARVLARLVAGAAEGASLADIVVEARTIAASTSIRGPERAALLQSLCADLADAGDCEAEVAALTELSQVLSRLRRQQAAEEHFQTARDKTRRMARWWPAAELLVDASYAEHLASTCQARDVRQLLTSCEGHLLHTDGHGQKARILFAKHLVCDAVGTDLLKQAEQEFGEETDPEIRAVVLFGLGTVLAERETSSSAAAEYADKGREALAEVYDPLGRVWVHSVRLRDLSARRLFGQAFGVLRELERTCEQVGDDHLTACVMLDGGTLCLAWGNPELAFFYLFAAVEAASAPESREVCLSALARRSRARLMLGAASDARRDLEEAVRLATTEDEQAATEVMATLAEHDLRCGSVARAIGLFEDVVKHQSVLDPDLRLRARAGLLCAREAGRQLQK